MWDRDKFDIYGNRKPLKIKDNSKTVFESGREARRRSRKEERKRRKI